MASEANSPLVSIMMPAYNAERYIGEAIASVREQTYANWELIIVDDGSTDHTAAIAAQAAVADPRVRLVQQPNGGEAVARNTALAHMHGELIAFLDADDAYLPHHLAAVVAYLQAHPDRDAVYTDGYHCDQEGRRLATLSSRRRGPFEGDLFEPLVRASDVFGPPLCVALRREGVMRRALAFDPQIVIGPDWEFFTRYAEEASFGYLAEPTCLYRVHTTNISVRTGASQRALSLARCRESAIGRRRFEECSLETRAAVFYDLLINCLTGHPERQTAITAWPQFQQLPAAEQARLLRLMASWSLREGVDAAPIASWLHRARALAPTDWLAAALAALYAFSPRLCRLAVRIKMASQPRRDAAPFADLAVKTSSWSLAF